VKPQPHGRYCHNYRTLGLPRPWLNSMPPRVPITWEAYARAAGSALGCPRIPTRGHTARLVGGFHTGNGEQHWIMPSPDPIDVHVGLRIRQRRVLLGMSMETLGAAVGLSFQMVQKYEVGINSIAASRLVDVAKALDVPPSFFFDGPSPKGQGGVVHTRNLRAGPRILGDSKSDGEGEYCRDDPGNCHNTSIAPPRCLSAKACAPCGPKPLGAGTGVKVTGGRELTHAPRIDHNGSRAVSFRLCVPKIGFGVDAGNERGKLGA
jgi:hypothetical protein